MSLGCILEPFLRQEMDMRIRSISHKYSRLGFSIIELIAVVAILGIMAMVAGPAMSRIVRHQRVNRASLLG